MQWLFTISHSQLKLHPALHCLLQSQLPKITQSSFLTRTRWLHAFMQWILAITQWLLSVTHWVLASHKDTMTSYIHAIDFCNQRVASFSHTLALASHKYTMASYNHTIDYDNHTMTSFSNTLPPGFSQEYNGFMPSCNRFW